MLINMFLRIIILCSKISKRYDFFVITQNYTSWKVMEKFCPQIIFQGMSICINNE